MCARNVITFLIDIMLHFKEKATENFTYFKYRQNILVGNVVSVANVTVNLELECATFCLNYLNSVGYRITKGYTSPTCELFDIVAFEF